MPLIAGADRAEHFARRLTEMRDLIPESAAEITALITELFAVSAALRDLFCLHSDPLYERRYAMIAVDVQSTLHSCDYTFDDLRTLLGGLDRPSYLSNATLYRQVWQDILGHFQQESGNPLSRRLGICTAFLVELAYELEGLPVDSRRMDELRWKIQDLLDKQVARPEALFANMSLGARSALVPRRSFERRRRPLRPSQSPPRPDQRRRPPPRPLSPDWFSEEDYYLSRDSDPPTSPTSTSYSESSTTSSAIVHWAPPLFEQPVSTTPFISSGQVSTCIGEDLPGAGRRLNLNYDKLVDLPFESGDLRVRLYIRQSDARARIYCRVVRPSRSRMESCLPLTSLEAVRARSSLQLCRPSRSGQSLLMWACLRFQSYERMVLFYCTFLALKAQDSSNCEDGSDRHELKGEDIEFSGKIVDDHYHHALRIFKDQDSEAVRLQASVYSGELKGTPVWTAFVTYQLRSFGWMQRVARHTIQLADLHRHIFTDEYVPPVGLNGLHELNFLNDDDAQVFWDAVIRLGQVERLRP